MRPEPGNTYVNGEGRQIFADELARFAGEVQEPWVTEVAERVAAPLRVAVCGRRGTGRRTVGRALECAGVVVTSPQGATGVTGADIADMADVIVYVVAEAAKPEDTAAVARLPEPVLVVMNKADLTGCAELASISARIGAPVQPMAGLLAVAALDNRLDDTLWAALQMLAAEPADLSSADRFVACPHPVPRRVRLRLCDTLELAAITRAVRLVRRGGSAGQVCALVRRISRIDAVTGRLNAVGAAVHYRRLLDAVTLLEALAADEGADSSRIGEFLSADNTVAARMATAVAVVEATGMTLDPAGADDPAAQLRRAVRWQCYSRGPVTGLHRACGLDIVRGSLRAWVLAGASA